jgi:hypothetical protein
MAASRSRVSILVDVLPVLFGSRMMLACQNFMGQLACSCASSLATRYPLLARMVAHVRELEPLWSAAHPNR